MSTPDATAQTALAHTPYRKSSRSTATGNCVLVANGPFSCQRPLLLPRDAHLEPKDSYQ